MPACSSRSASRWVLAALVAPFLLLAGVLLVAIAGITWFPVHDFALLELSIRDIGSVNTPLVGNYSRYGWSHPGPALTAVLAVPYWLGGRASEALLAGAVLVNVGSIVAGIAVAWRRGGAILAGWSAVVFAGLVGALGADRLITPWNPSVTVLPFLLLLLLAWAWSNDDLAMAPLAVGVGSVVVQGHIGYAVPVGLALAYAATLALMERRHRPRRPADRRWWIVTGVVAFAFWLPVVLDQVAGSGNAGAIIRHFLTSDAPVVGVGEAMRISASDLSPLGPWTGRIDVPTAPFSGAASGVGVGWLLLPAAGLVAAYLVARRSGPPGAALMVGLALVCLPATVLPIARISDVPHTYLVQWTWAMAAFVWLAVGYPFVSLAAHAVSNRVSLPRRSQTVVGVTVVLVVVALMLARAADDPTPPEVERGEVVAALTPEVLSTAQDAGGPVLVSPVTGEGEGFPAPSSRQLAAGLALQLERVGIDIRVIDEDWALSPGSGGARLFDDHRAAAGPTTGTFTVVIGPLVDTFEPPAGSSLVAVVDDRPTDIEIPALAAELEEAFRAEGFPDLADSVAAGTAGFGWVFLATPELAEYATQVDRLLDARAADLAAVWWTPTAE